MGVFNTTGKVLTPYTLCSLIPQPHIQAVLLVPQGKAQVGQRPVEVFMCSVTKKTGILCKKLLQHGPLLPIIALLHCDRPILNLA